MAYVSKRKKLYLIVFISLAVVIAAIALFVIYVMPKRATIKFFGDVAEEITVEKGEVMPELPKPDKYGHNFEGWYYSEIINEMNRVIEGVDVVEENITLYPNYVKGTYTLSFNKNGGEGNEIPEITKVYEELFYFPTETTAGIYGKDGKVLNCWAFDVEGKTLPTYKPGDRVGMFGENRTAYAIWDFPKTVIQYVTGPGAEYMQPKEYYTGELVPEEAQLCTSTKKGYVFDGWYETDSFTNKIDFTTYTLRGNEVRFYAKWNPIQFSVTFYVDGTIYPVNGNNHTPIYYDSVITKPSPDPERIGKLFVGWCIDETLLSQYNFATKVTGNINLYAKWGDIPVVENETPVSAFNYTTNSADNTITITGVKDSSKNITSLIFPRQIDGRNVTRITNVLGLEQLTEVAIPYTVKYISEESFSNCSKIVKFRMISKSNYYEVYNDVLYTKHNDLKDLDDSTRVFDMLYRYPAAKPDISYTTNANTRDVMKFAFNNAQYLQTLVIDAENVRGNSLQNCLSISNLTLSERVAGIEENAFLGCNSLVNVTSNSNQIKVLDGAIYNTNYTRLIKYFNKEQNVVYTAPTTLTNCDEYAFADVTNLQSVIFDVNFNDIGSYAFSGCTGLKTLTFRAFNFVSVGANLLHDCNVESVTLNKIETNALYVRLKTDGLADDKIFNLT